MERFLYKEDNPCALYVPLGHQRTFLGTGSNFFMVSSDGRNKSKPGDKGHVIHRQRHTFNRMSTTIQNHTENALHANIIRLTIRLKK